MLGHRFTVRHISGELTLKSSYFLGTVRDLWEERERASGFLPIPLSPAEKVTSLPSFPLVKAEWEGNLNLIVPLSEPTCSAFKSEFHQCMSGGHKPITWPVASVLSILALKQREAEIFRQKWRNAIRMNMVGLVSNHYTIMLRHSINRNMILWS